MGEISTADGSRDEAAAAGRFKRAWKNGERGRGSRISSSTCRSRKGRCCSRSSCAWRGSCVAAPVRSPAAEEHPRRSAGQDSTISAVALSPLEATTRGGSGTEPVGPPPRQSPRSRPPAGSPPSELANHTDYEIVRELGVGGMGVVYLAYNRLMARRHEVLKVSWPAHRRATRRARPLLAGDPRRRPVAASQRCERLLGVPVRGTSLAFAMEYVEGVDLPDGQGHMAS